MVDLTSAVELPASVASYAIMTESAPPRALARQIVGVIGGLLLLALAWTGVSGFFNQWAESKGIGQIAQTCSELVYASGALLSLVTTVWAQRWAGIARLVFIAGTTLAGGLAPVVWGDAPFWTGLLSGAASLALAFGIHWMFRWGYPVPKPPTSPLTEARTR
jgi:hypothetical protein